MADEHDSKAIEQAGNTAFEASQGRFAREPGAAAAAGSIGGRKSGEARRKRRMMRDAARDILNLSAGKLPGADALAQALQAAGIDAATVADALVLAQALRAAGGDTEAARYIRDTAGERPADLLQVSAADHVDAETVLDMTDEELAELAAGRQPAALPAADVAFDVAAEADAAPEHIVNQ